MLWSWLLSLIASLILQPTRSAHVDVGVRLQRQPFTVRPNHGYGTILIHAPLPDVNFKIDTFSCSNNTTSCVDSTKLDLLLTEAIKKASAEYLTTKELLKYFRMQKQDKRALADFVGQASKYLFGTATQSDLKLVYRHMNDLFGKMTEITSTQIADHLAVVGTKLDSQFAAVTHSLRADAAEIGRIDNVARENRKALNMILRREHIAFDVKIPQLEKLEYLQDSLRQWNEGLIMMQRGKLPRQIVHVNELRIALKQLNAKISQRDSSAGVATTLTDILNLYTLDGCEAFFMENHFFIRLPVPIIRSDTRMTVYSATSHAVPIQNSGGYTKVMIANEYLAVNDDGTYYAELTESDLQTCRRQGYYCSTINSLTSTRQANCLLSILYNHPHEEITRLCQTRAFAGKPPPASIQLNDTHVLLQSPENLAHLHCPQRPFTTIRLARSQITRIPCGCFITTNSITTTIKSCDVTNNLTISYPFNMPVYNHLKDSVPEEEILSLTEPGSGPNIPNLEKIINQTADPGFGANLNEVMNKVRTIAHNGGWENEPTDDVIPWPLDWPTYTIYALIGAWLCVLSMLQLHAWIRFRTIQALLITKLPSVDARPLILHSTPTPATMQQLELPAVLTIGAYVALSFLGIYCISILTRAAMNYLGGLYRTCQCLTSPDDRSGRWDLFVKISDDRNSQILYLTNIPNEGTQTLITETPVCKSAELHYSLVSHLRFSWSGALRFSVNGHTMKICLPQELVISSTAAAQLRKILSHPCAYSLLLRSEDDYYFTIPRPDKDRAFCPATNKFITY